MTRLYGWGLKKERLKCKVPHGHWHTTTFITALRNDKIIAPYFVNGAINKDSFLDYIENNLCPNLSEGDIVICDNLSTHKVAGVKEALGKLG